MNNMNKIKYFDDYNDKLIFYADFDKKLDK